MAYPESSPTNFEIGAYRKGVLASLGGWEGLHDPNSDGEYYRKKYENNPYPEHSDLHNCWKLGYEVRNNFDDVDYDILGKDLKEYFDSCWENETLDFE